MQTQLSFLNLSPKQLSAEGLKTTGNIPGKGKTPLVDNGAAFMEIMGKLLNLPEAQMENILSEIGETASVEDELSQLGLGLDPEAIEDELSQLDPETGTDESSADGPCELIQLLWALNGAVDSGAIETSAEQKGDSFLEIAKEIIDDQMESDASSGSEQSQSVIQKWTDIIQQMKSKNAIEATGDATVQAGKPQAPVVEPFIATKDLPAGGVQNSRDGHATDGPASDSVDGEKTLENELDPLLEKMLNKPDKEKDTIGRTEKDAKIGTGDTQPLQTHHKQFTGHAKAQALNLVPENQTETVKPEAPGAHLAEDGVNIVDEASQKPAQATEHSDPDSQRSDMDRASGDTFQKATAALRLHDGDISRSGSNGGRGLVDGAENKNLPPMDKEGQSDVIRQIVQRMTLNTQGDQSKMVIRLKPEYLGNVHLQVLTENHQVSVRMTAESHAVKEIVQQNIQHLRMELQHHGLEIQKFDVFVGHDSQGWAGSQDQTGFRQALRQRQQRMGVNKKATGLDSTPVDRATQPHVRQNDLNEVDYFA